MLRFRKVQAVDRHISIKLFFDLSWRYRVLPE